MNGTYRIVGGHRLSGTVLPIQNKNSLMAALPVAVMCNRPVRFRDLPATSDVETFLSIYRHWGAAVEEAGRDVAIDCRPVSSHRVDADLGSRFRAPVLFVGPLLARFGVAELPMPGGCRLGQRALETHIAAFRALGVTVEEVDGYLRFTAPRGDRPRRTVWLPEASVTATENVAMYAAGTGTTVEIVDAACEPHVRDLLDLLCDLGARIDGINTNRVTVTGGIDGRTETVDFRPSPDHVDISGFIVAAGMTGGRIRIRGANLPDIMTGLIDWFERFGLAITRDGADLIADGTDELFLNAELLPSAAPGLPKLAVRPWPGFPTDVLPVMVSLACKMNGRILFQNWMYEHGLNFVHQLNQLGADIELLDSQRVVVPEPPAHFHGGEVTPPEVIQSVKSLFLAALADPAETVIHGTDILRRRYPDVLAVYRSLGAEIEHVHVPNGPVAPQGTGAHNGHSGNGSLGGVDLPTDIGAAHL